jgi:hypothetical protein
MWRNVSVHVFWVGCTAARARGGGGGAIYLLSWVHYVTSPLTLVDFTLMLKTRGTQLIIYIAMPIADSCCLVYYV